MGTNFEKERKKCRRSFFARIVSYYVAPEARLFSHPYVYVS
jgi:hypothetical protein